MMQETDYRFAAQRRLRELQLGASPDYPNAGICCDIHRTLAQLGFETHDFDGKCIGYTLCSDIFTALGLDFRDPLGERGKWPWEGTEGVDRRELAGKMADYLQKVLHA